MPINDTLTPLEAAHIAANSYFTLKDWIHMQPVAGVESRSNLHNRVLGPANVGVVTDVGSKKGHVNSSLQGIKGGLGNSRLSDVHAAATGFGTTSGFGYTLTYEGQGKRHAIIATRGTRPEMLGFGRKPDLISDLRVSYTNFMGYGSVHKGFKLTFDSMKPSLFRGNNAIIGADVIHCVGHSLGGAVATLIAGHFAAFGKSVKLYTFGCPRVGCFNTHAAIENKIGPENIYRVAHDLDVVTTVAPFPFIHLHPKPLDMNNFTVRSRIATINPGVIHNMNEYITTAKLAQDWQGLRNSCSRANHDNSVLARRLLHNANNTGWVARASIATLMTLFRLFSYVLRGIASTISLGVHVVDLLAEVLIKGLHRLTALGSEIHTLLKHAATWAGIATSQDITFTEQVIKHILFKMLTSLRQMSATALSAVTRNVSPVKIGIGGAWALSSAAVF